MYKTSVETQNFTGVLERVALLRLYRVIPGYQGFKGWRGDIISVICLLAVIGRELDSIYECPEWVGRLCTTSNATTVVVDNIPLCLWQFWYYFLRNMKMGTYFCYAFHLPRSLAQLTPAWGRFDLTSLSSPISQVEKKSNSTQPPESQKITLSSKGGKICTCNHLWDMPPQQKSCSTSPGLP